MGGPIIAAKCGGIWENRFPAFSIVSPRFARTMPSMTPPTAHTDLPLLLAITVFFWLLAQAWALIVFWAESRATRPSSPDTAEESRDP